MDPVIIRGTPIAYWGWRTADISGWMDGTIPQREVAEIAGRHGVAVNRHATGRARELQVTFNTSDPDLYDRETYLNNLDRLTHGVFPLTTIDRPTVITRCMVKERKVTAVEGMKEVLMAMGDFAVEYTFLAIDGVSLSKHTTYIEVFDGVKTRVPIGTATIHPITIHKGPWLPGATRVFDYYSASGILYGTMSVTPPAGQSLGADDHLEIDHNNRTLTKVIGGVRSSARSWKSGGRFLVFDMVDSLIDAPPYVIFDGEAYIMYIKTWNL